MAEKVKRKFIKTIFKAKRKIPVSGIVGYCHCPQHTGFVTDREDKKHHCLQKNCKYLSKNKRYVKRESV